MQQWSRRGFLSSKGIGTAAGGLLGALLKDEPISLLADRHVCHWCIARRAMACDFSVYLPPTLANVMAVGGAALDEIDRMEEALSAYRPDSTISQLNVRAAERPIRVDDWVLQLLRQAAELHKQTDGAVDIAAGALSAAWGFYDHQPRVPSRDDLATALQCSGIQHVELNEQDHTVFFRRAGLMLNLGCIGKGYAIDRAIQKLQQEYGVTSALIQGGMSSIYALGTSSPQSDGWLISVQDPCEPGRALGTVRLRNRAMGTSGITHQHFVANGQRYGHLIDPRSGWPTDELAGVSVLAPDAATADALSTALFVMGLDKGREFCQNNPRVGALFVRKADSRGSSKFPRVVTFNIASPDLGFADPVVIEGV